MHVDVYESTTTPGPYLLVQRGGGRMAAPERVRAGFVPGRLVTRLRMISTDAIVGLDVVEAIAAIHRNKYYVAQGPIEFDVVHGQRLPL
jgi:hypothetical protein